MSRLLALVNADQEQKGLEKPQMPVMATPAAFGAGVAAGAKAAGAVVTAAGAGAAVGQAVGS